MRREAFGLEVRLNQEVDRVMVRDRRAEGVVLADGTEITSRIVVSNINAKRLYLEKIGEEHLPWLARLWHQELPCLGLRSHDQRGA